MVGRTGPHSGLGRDYEAASAARRCGRPRPGLGGARPLRRNALGCRGSARLGVCPVRAALLAGRL